MITTSAIRAGLPQAIDDRLLSEQVGVWNEQPEGIPSTMDGYLQLVHLYDIAGQILEKEDPGNADPIERWSSKGKKATTIDTQDILTLDSMLTEWHNSLPRYLRHDPNAKVPADTESATSKLSPSARKSIDTQAKRLYQRCSFMRTGIRGSIQQLTHR